MNLSQITLLVFAGLIVVSVVGSRRRGKWGPGRFDGGDDLYTPGVEASPGRGWFDWLPSWPKRRKSLKRLEREILETFGRFEDGPAILRRTLANLRRQYPGQEEIWYYEKAYDDLRRDRRF